MQPTRLQDLDKISLMPSTTSTMTFTTISGDTERQRWTPPGNLTWWWEKNAYLQSTTRYLSIAIHGWLEESECDKARNINQPPFSHFPNFITWGPCRMIKTPSERGLDLGLRHNHKWDSKHNGWYNGYGGTTNSCENKPCFDSSLYMNTSQEFPGYSCIMLYRI